ncbi:hypothetical protein [Streptomyces cyanogenus]|uniref:Secreted protein n=1 Tax=Streptomyces cyanogenus TaxID=80860 RepID=A0ABX7TI32_STRCY|nr:hypothetical protein [Streptomyces cyanogenus]QTD96082.1 hypothetical protein S1361_01925 [Streptomyces cyanogenus]
MTITRKTSARTRGTSGLTPLFTASRTTVAVAAATLLLATPADAAASFRTPPVRTAADSCGTSVNPNTYIRPDRRHNGPATKIGNTRIQLRYGNRPGGPRYYWATITHAGRGDKVTLYWDIDYGSWRDSGACSATVHSGGSQNTRAVKFVHGRGFHLEAQACGKHAGRSRCAPPSP